MYGVLFKTNGFETTIFTGSLANCVESAIDRVIDIVGYFEGYFEPEEFFMGSHPPSTVDMPRHYCIPDLNTFRIYRHVKLVGIFFSEHVYDKIATVKVIKVDDVSLPHEIQYINRSFDWDEVLREMMGDTPERVLPALTPELPPFPKKRRTPSIITTDGDSSE